MTVKAASFGIAAMFAMLLSASAGAAQPNRGAATEKPGTVQSQAAGEKLGEVVQSGSNAPSPTPPLAGRDVALIALRVGSSGFGRDEYESGHEASWPGSTRPPTRTPLPQYKPLIRNTILLRSASSRRGRVDGRDERGHDGSRQNSRNNS